MTLSMRPELFKISKDLKEEENSFEASVQEKMYLGESEQWKLSAQNNQILAKVLLKNEEEESFPEGSQISCAIPPRAITLFKQSS